MKSAVTTVLVLIYLYLTGVWHSFMYTLIWLWVPHEMPEFEYGKFAAEGVKTAITNPTSFMADFPGSLWYNASHIPIVVTIYAISALLWMYPNKRIRWFPLILLAFALILMMINAAKMLYPVYAASMYLLLLGVITAMAIASELVRRKLIFSFGDAEPLPFKQSVKRNP